MKKIFILMCAMVVLLIMNETASAIPINYTFDGVVVANDTGQPTASVALGTSVSYSFVIDLAVDHYYVRNDGIVGHWTDSTRDHFYGDMLSGRVLSGDGYYNNPSAPGYANNKVKEYYYGVEFLDPTFKPWLVTGSDDSMNTLIAKAMGAIADWSIGDNFRLYESQYFSDGSHVVLTTDLILTAVTSAVPEPSTMLLLGSGLFGLCAYRKKFKK